MSQESAIGMISALCSSSLGVFRGHDAIALGVSRNQLAALKAAGVVERVLPDTYRMSAVARSHEQSLRAALLWAGRSAAAAGRSAAAIYGLAGVEAPKPEIVVPRERRLHSTRVVVHRTENNNSLMIRRHHGVPVTAIEATLVTLGRRPRHRSLRDRVRGRAAPAAHLRPRTPRLPGPVRRRRPGVSALRALIAEIDPVHAARSVLEVKTRRLLVASGFTDFVREFPLQWNGRSYRFDFAFVRQRTILETNGRRWHADADDYEFDNEKWNVPGRHGYRIVLATWDKVERAAGADAGGARRDSRGVTVSRGR